MLCRCRALYTKCATRVTCTRSGGDRSVAHAQRPDQVWADICLGLCFACTFVYPHLAIVSLCSGFCSGFPFEYGIIQPCPLCTGWDKAVAICDRVRRLGRAGCGCVVVVGCVAQQCAPKHLRPPTVGGLDGRTNRTCWRVIDVVVHYVVTNGKYLRAV